MNSSTQIEDDVTAIALALYKASEQMRNDQNNDARAKQAGISPVAAFFVSNVTGLLESSRLDSVAKLAGVPPERVPAVRAALAKAVRDTLAS